MGGVDFGIFLARLHVVGTLFAFGHTQAAAQALGNINNHFAIHDLAAINRANIDAGTAGSALGGVMAHHVARRCPRTGRAMMNGIHDYTGAGTAITQGTQMSLSVIDIMNQSNLFAMTQNFQRLRFGQLSGQPGFD